MSLFLMSRKISAYSGADPHFLGLFDNEQQAVAARIAYLSQIRAVDPWAEQAYRESEPESDVQISEIEDGRVNTFVDVAFLVSAVVEALGQCARRFEAAFSELETANQYVQNRLGECTELPDYFNIDEVRLNVVERHDIIERHANAGVNSVFAMKAGSVCVGATDLPAEPDE
jgi:hypothetical protein